MTTPNETPSVEPVAYAWLSPGQQALRRRVILLGTAHTRGTKGLIASSAAAFLTPLGPVPTGQGNPPAVEKQLNGPAWSRGW